MAAHMTHDVLSMLYVKTIDRVAFNK